MSLFSAPKSRDVQTADVIQQLARFDNAVSKEFTLVSDRMNWLVVSESFLFAAFAASASVWKSQAPNYLITGILILAPIYGILLVLVIIPAIKAAHSAVEKLKDAREELENLLPQQIRTKNITLNDLEHAKGNIPANIVPASLVGAWTVLLLLVLADQ